MKYVLVLVLIVAFFVSGCYLDYNPSSESDSIFSLGFGNSVYDFTVESIDGVDVPLSIFEGDVLLIVNTASECGLTYQYEGLQKIYEKYGMYDFNVLAFPSNSFNQELETDEDVKSFCKDVMETTFPLFARMDVIGENKSLLFQFLVDNAPYENQGTEIEWNFAKFLIDREGNIYRRYHPQVEPEDLAEDIEMLLGLS